MTFENTRIILETRMFGGGDTARLLPITADGVAITTFRDGQTFKQPTNAPFIIMFINDSGNRTTGFAGTLRKANGVVRFRISVPRDLSNPVRTARLIADAIDSRMGFMAGDESVNDGGTLFTQSGVLNKASDNDNGYMIYTLDFIYDYYD